MKRFRPDLRALGFLRIVTALSALVACILSVVTLTDYRLLMYIAVGIAAGVAFALDFIVFPLYFSRVSYNISNSFVIKQTGIFIRSEQIMKLRSFQYSSVISTPFSKFTSLNFIVIHALGAKITLHFIARDEIEQLLRLITSPSDSDGRE